MDNSPSPSNGIKGTRPCPRTITLAHLEALVSRLILVPSPPAKDTKTIDSKERKEDKENDVDNQSTTVTSSIPTSSRIKIKLYKHEDTRSTLIPVPPLHSPMNQRRKGSKHPSNRYYKGGPTLPSPFRNFSSSSSLVIPGSNSNTVPTMSNTDKTIAFGRSITTVSPKKFQRHSPSNKTSPSHPPSFPTTFGTRNASAVLRSPPLSLSTSPVAISPASASTSPHSQRYRSSNNYTPCSPVPVRRSTMETTLENQLDNDMYEDYDKYANTNINLRRSTDEITDTRTNNARRPSSAALLQAQELLQTMLPRSHANSPFKPIPSSASSFSSSVSRVSPSRSSDAPSPSQTLVVRRYTPQPASHFLIVSSDEHLNATVEHTMQNRPSSTSSVPQYRPGLPPRPPNIPNTPSSVPLSHQNTNAPLQLSDLLHNHSQLTSHQFSRRTYEKYRRCSLPSSVVVGTPAVLADTYQQQQHRENVSPSRHRRNTVSSNHPEHSSFVSRHACNDMAFSLTQIPFPFTSSSALSSSSLPTRIGELVIQATIQRLRRWIKAQIHDNDRAEANHAAANTLHILHMKQRVFTRLYRRILLRHRSKILVQARQQVHLSQAWSTWKSLYGIHQSLKRLRSNREQRTLRTVFETWRIRTNRSTTLRARTVAFHCYRVSSTLAKWRNTVFQARTIETKGCTARLRRMWIQWKAVLAHRYRTLLAADRYHLLRLQETRLPRILVHWRLWVTRNQYIRNAYIEYGQNQMVKALHRWRNYVNERNQRIHHFRTVVSRYYLLVRCIQRWRTFVNHQQHYAAVAEVRVRRQRIRQLQSAWTTWRNVFLRHQQQQWEEKRAQVCRRLLQHSHRVHIQSAFAQWKQFTLTAQQYEEQCTRRLLLRKGIRVFRNYRLQQRRYRLQLTRAIVHRGFILVVKIMRKLHRYAQQQKEVRKRLSVFLNESLPRIQRRSLLHQWFVRVRALRNYEEGSKKLQRIGNRIRNRAAFQRWIDFAKDVRKRKEALATLSRSYRRSRLTVNFSHWYRQVECINTAEDYEYRALTFYRQHLKERLFRRWKERTALKLRLHRIGNLIERSVTLRIARHSWQHWITRTRERLTEKERDNQADRFYVTYRLGQGLFRWVRFTTQQQSDHNRINQAINYRTRRSLHQSVAQWKLWTEQQRLYHEYVKLGKEYYRHQYLRKYFRSWLKLTRDERQLRFIRQQEEYQAQRELMNRVLIGWRTWTNQIRKRKRTGLSTLFTVLHPFIVRSAFQCWRTTVLEMRHEEYRQQIAKAYHRRRRLRYAIVLWRTYPADRRKRQYQQAAAYHCYYRTLCTRIFRAWKYETKELVKYRRMSSRLTRWLLTTVFEKLKTYTRTRKAKRRQIQFLNMAIIEGNPRIHSWCSVLLSLLYRFQTIQRITVENESMLYPVHGTASSLSTAVLVPFQTHHKLYDIFIEPPVYEHLLIGNPIERPLTYLGQQTIHRSVMFRTFVAWRQFTQRMKLQDQQRQTDEDNDPSLQIVNQTAEELAIIHWESMKIRQALRRWKTYEREKRARRTANELAFSYYSLRTLENYFTEWKKRYRMNKISVQLSTHLLMNQRMARCLQAWSRLTYQRQEVYATGSLRFWFLRWKLRHRARRILADWRQKSLSARVPNAEIVMIDESDKYLLVHLINQSLRKIRQMKVVSTGSISSNSIRGNDESWGRSSTPVTRSSTKNNHSDAEGEEEGFSLPVELSSVSSRITRITNDTFNKSITVPSNYTASIPSSSASSVNGSTMMKKNRLPTPVSTPPSDKGPLSLSAKRKQAKLRFQSLLATIPTPETPEDRRNTVTTTTTVLSARSGTTGSTQTTTTHTNRRNTNTGVRNNKENTTVLSSSPNLLIPFRPEETSLYRLYSNSPTLMENERDAENLHRA